MADERLENLENFGEGEKVAPKVPSKKELKRQKKQQNKQAKAAAKVAKVSAVASTQNQGNPTTSSEVTPVIKKIVKVGLAAAVVAAVIVAGVCIWREVANNKVISGQQNTITGQQEQLDNAEKDKNEAVQGAVDSANKEKDEEWQGKLDDQLAAKDKESNLAQLKTQAQGIVDAMAGDVARALAAKNTAAQCAETTPQAQEYADLAEEEYNNAVKAQQEAQKALEDLGKITNPDEVDMSRFNQYAQESKDAADAAEGYATLAQDAVAKSMQETSQVTLTPEDVARVADLVRGAANVGTVQAFYSASYSNGELSLYFTGVDGYDRQGIYLVKVHMDSNKFTNEDVLNAIEAQRPASTFLVNSNEISSDVESDQKLGMSSTDKEGNTVDATMDDVSIQVTATYDKNKDRTTITYTVVVKLEDGTISVQPAQKLVVSGRMSKSEAEAYALQDFASKNATTETQKVGENAEIELSGNNAKIVVYEDEAE